MRRTTAALLAAGALAGCSGRYSPDTYSSSAVQQAAKVEQGIIVGARKVDVTASGVVGATAGAAAGSAVGASVPGSSLNSALTAIGGGVVGGVIGVGVERATGDTTATEYIVRKDNGELVSVTQKEKVALQLGQRVLVIAGSQARIVPDYTFRVDANKAATGTASTALKADSAPVTLSLPSQPAPAEPAATVAQ